MPKCCNAEGCKRNQWGGGYCDWHQYMRTDKKPNTKKKKRYRINPFSEKRAKKNIEYSKESKAFIAEHPFCEIQSPVCVRVSQGIHHVKGKSTISLLMDKRFWKRSCNPCNEWIEANDKEARRLGHKKSKHNDH